MNTENSKTFYPNRLLLDLGDKTKIAKWRKNFCIIKS